MDIMCSMYFKFGYASFEESDIIFYVYISQSGNEGSSAGETEVPSTSFEYNWAWKTCLKIFPDEFWTHHESKHLGYRTSIGV